MQALQELREPSREVDVATPDVVERQHSSEQTLPFLRHRRAQQHAIPARPPRVRGESVEPVGRTLRRVETPPHAAVASPLRDLRQVVVVETEATAHRCTSGQVEHLRGGHAAARELEQLREDAQHRVRLSERTVGQTHAQVGAPRLGRNRFVRIVSTHAGAERGMDQRREVLDVGTHDQDVARLQGRVVGEQVQDRVAQDLDLAGPAVAGVHLHTAIRRVEQHPLVGDVGKRQPRWRPVGSNVGLDPCQQRRSLFLDDDVVVHDRRARVGAQHQLHLTRVPPPRAEQWIPRQRRGLVVVAAEDRRALAHECGDPCPQLGRRVQQEEMNVTLGGQCMQHCEVTPRQPCQTEERYASGQVDERGIGP